jgi:hypothetical protein
MGDGEVEQVWPSEEEEDGAAQQQQVAAVVGGARAPVREVPQQGCGLQQVLTPAGGLQVRGVEVALLLAGVVLIDRLMDGQCRIIPRDTPCVLSICILILSM